MAEISINEHIEALNVSREKKLELQARLCSGDPDFYKAIDPRMCINDEFFEHLKSLIPNRQHAIIEILGDTGSGKSRTAWFLQKKYLNPAFGIDDCYFHMPFLLNRLGQLERYGSVHMDENKEEYGEGVKRQAAEWGTFCQGIRQRMISITSCSVVQHMRPYSHYELETLFVDKERQVCRLVVRKRMLIGGFPSYLTIGWIETEEPTQYVGNKFVEDYETKKESFLDELQHKGEVGDLTERIAAEIEALPLFQALAKTHKGKKRDVSVSEIKELIHMSKDQGGAGHPELKRNNEAETIARRVLLNRQFARIREAELLENGLSGQSLNTPANPIIMENKKGGISDAVRDSSCEIPERSSEGKKGASKLADFGSEADSVGSSQGPEALKNG